VLRYLKVLCVSVVASLLVVQTAGAEPHRLRHEPGCRSQACDLRVDIAWGRSHPRAHIASADVAFDECVEMKESTDTNDDTGNGYYGYEQWLPTTYNAAARMAGLPERTLPTEASRAEQRAAFNAYEPGDPTAWPRSVPECGGL
jgi:hypothetical protein